jgi:hypothetical protein
MYSFLQDPAAWTQRPRVSGGSLRIPGTNVVFTTLSSTIFLRRLTLQLEPVFLHRLHI